MSNTDNEIAPSDTLYLNNWWAKLDVYNYEEAILLQDFCERWDETSNGDNTRMNYNTLMAVVDKSAT